MMISFAITVFGSHINQKVLFQWISDLKLAFKSEEILDMYFDAQ